MAARAIWRGQIRLALVSIPIELFPATRSGAQIQFHQVHEPSGKRIKYEKVVPGIGPVDRDEIMKGYEVSKGHYVLLDPEEIESVKLESRKTLELVQFVDEDDIESTFFEKPYYVVPADDLAEEAYVVLTFLPFWKGLSAGQKADYLDRWNASAEWREAIAFKYDHTGFDIEADARDSEAWAAAHPLPARRPWWAFWRQGR